VPALETGCPAFAWPLSTPRLPWLEPIPGASSYAAPCSLPEIAYRRGRRSHRGQWPDRRQSRKRFVTRVRPAPRREACYARARVSFPAMVSRRRVDPKPRFRTVFVRSPREECTGADSASGDLPYSSFSTFGSMAACDDGMAEGRLARTACRTQRRGAGRTLRGELACSCAIGTLSSRRKRRRANDSRQLRGDEG
jgi:hypothetical protein